MTSAQPDLIASGGTDEGAWHRWGGLTSLREAQFPGLRSAVVVAAHPDDEVLAVAGIMAQFGAAGVRLRLVAVTDGEGSHPGLDPAVIGARRAAESAAALRALELGDTEVIRLGLPDTRLELHEAELTSALRELTAGFDLCLAPWEADGHADHEAAGRAARLACDSVLTYPIWMWHWAVPGDWRVPWHRALRVPLTGGVALKKRAAIRAFASQLSGRQDAGPVLSAGVVAHFIRITEVLFR